MGRGAYDTIGLPKPKPPLKDAPVSRTEEERYRRDRWHHKYGFKGEKASASERAAEEQRKKDFSNGIDVVPVSRSKKSRSKKRPLEHR